MRSTPERSRADRRSRSAAGNEDGSRPAVTPSPWVGARRAAVIAMAAAFGAVMVPAAITDAAPGDQFSFAFIGDVPYTAAQVALMPNLTAALNADPDVAFVAHSGDTKGGSDSCSDAALEATFNLFQALQDPFWYTIGDNEWTDCHRNADGNFAPLDRLAKVRSLYFATPGQTTGGTPLTVATQADSAVPADRVLVENTWFDQQCVTFGDIHSVSSANGRLDPDYAGASSNFPVETAAQKAARLAEVEARIAGDVRWIDQIFAAADANGSGAVFLMMQAEPKLGPIDNDSVFGDEFVAIHDRIYALADAHPDVQIVIAHGDQHNDLWQPEYGGADHPNIARLENWGSNTGGVLAVTKWQKVTVTCGEPGTKATFEIADQTVPQLPADVPEGPLALGLLGMGVAGAAVVGLRARRRRFGAG